MPPTTAKGIRLTTEEHRRLQQLLPHFPEVRSEADFLHLAYLIGQLVLATQATRPGRERYGGYDPADLAALLQSRLLPALHFLEQQGALPALVLRHPSTVLLNQSEAPSSLEQPSDIGQINPSAAADLGELGSDFLD